jgi:hypothetical protein
VVNNYRKAHDEAPALTVDTAAAKVLQSLVDEYVGKEDFVEVDDDGKKVFQPLKF